MSTEKALIEALSALVTGPPRPVIDVVFSSWIRVDGPVGELYVAFGEKGVNFIRAADAVEHDAITFEETFRVALGKPLRHAEHPPAGLMPALHGRSASTVPVDLGHLTDFERDVLTATRRIPSGQVRPYGWVAREIGRPKAVRAVGTALGNNPVPVLIPCHRVVRSDGQLGEYVFGRAMKEDLLRAEKTNVDEVADLAKRKVFY
ncbi:MAG: MGMT family protein, partial [Actinomycetota bacterium]|nr:MGMT family protein [Actinomycetota bacterium]